MVNPDEAEEKFEKLATSMKGTSGDEEDKNEACESVQQAVQVLDELKSSTYKSYIDKAQPAARSLSSKREVAKKKQGIDRAKDSITGTKKKRPKSRYNIKNYEGQKKQYLVGKETRRNHDDYGKIPRNDAYREQVDQQLSDISKTIMERGITHSMGSQGMKKLRGNKPSTNIPTESNPSGGVRNPNDPTSYPSGGEIKDTPSIPSKPDTPSIKTDILKKSKPKPSVEMSSYDPLSNKEILGISEKILKKNFDLGEEGYDIARDEGKVKPSKDKKDATTMPVSDEVKKTQKKNKGASAYEIVKKKYGKAVMDVDKKKKEEK